MALVIACGSSTMNGLGDWEAGGLPARLRRTFGRRYATGEDVHAHAVWDQSATGERISSTKTKLGLSLTDRRVQRTSKLTIVAALGAYDSCVHPDTGKPQTDIETFSETAHAIGRLILDDPIYHEKTKLIFLGMTPLADNVVKLSKNEEFRQIERRLYDRRLAQVSANLGATFISMYDRRGDPVAGDMDEYVSKDGVHPGVNAHRLMHELVQPEIDAHFGTYHQAARVIQTSPIVSPYPGQPSLTTQTERIPEVA